MRLLRTQYQPAHAGCSPIYGMLLAAAACFLATTSARAQSVEMTTVKYEGLGEVVKKHRGKVVYVNFWSFY